MRKGLNKIAFIVFQFGSIISLNMDGCFAQNSDLFSQSELILNLEKSEGQSPEGSDFIGSGTKEQAFSAQICTKLLVSQGVPAWLKNPKEYYCLINKSQFYCQAYKMRLISKSELLEMAEDYKFGVDDTLIMPETQLRCGFSVVSGTDENGEEVVICDLNQNMDFSDDVVKPLSKRFGEGVLVTAKIDYLENGHLKTELQSVNIVGRASDVGAMLMFSFPGLRFSKISFHGHDYLVCTSSVCMFRPVIYILPDKPYFGPVLRDQQLLLGDKQALEGQMLTFTKFERNGRTIVLKNEKQTNPTEAIIATQTGFLAPFIKGISMAGDTVSTANFKGKWIYVDFWSTTCGPCIAEFPRLKQIYQKMDRQKIEFLGVVVEYGKGSLNKILKEHNLPWPILNRKSDRTVSQGYDIQSYPSTFLIDPSGVIRRIDVRASELEGVLGQLL